MHRNECGFLYSYNVIQLSGRAGRNGNQACAVLVTNKAEIKSCKDRTLTEMVETKENCRRRALLSGLSSTEAIPAVQPCCDACGDLPIQALKFIRPIRAKRTPKKKPVRKASEQTIKILRNRLKVERKHIIHDSGKLKALGGAMICPIACIDEICNRMDYINSLDDILSIPGLRTQFVSRFFEVVKNIFLI